MAPKGASHEAVADDTTGGRLVLSDPRAIRAIAHPARIEIIRALFDGEELTATECAQLTGLSPSATSYHLKALERWGIVEPAERRPDGRDRPWRATGRSLQVDAPESLAAPAETTILTSFLNKDRDLALAFARHESRQPPEWRQALNLMTGERWMTPEELADVVAALHAVLDSHRQRNRQNRPDNSRRVRISAMTVPLDPAEGQ